MSSTDSLRQAPTRSSLPAALVGNLLLAMFTVGASPQAIQLQQQLGDVRTYLESAASSIRDRRRERFSRLSRQWREETQWLSSTTEIAMHPAYQAIIGMGREGLPMILEELRTNSGYWYWALKAISNEDPVPPCDRGAINKMKSAWLRWGEQKGIAIE